MTEHTEPSCQFNTSSMAEIRESVAFDIDLFRNQILPYMYLSFRRYQRFLRERDEVWAHMVLMEICKKLAMKQDVLGEFMNLNGRYGAKEETFIFTRLDRRFNTVSFYEGIDKDQASTESAKFEIAFNEGDGGIVHDILLNVTASDYGAGNRSIPLIYLSAEEGKNYEAIIYPDNFDKVSLPFCKYI